MAKSADAFRTISEVADWLEVPAHVLRFWESKFSQVKPVKRAGGRRYYRPADMRLLAGIKILLHDQGMTIKAVQKMLREEGVRHVSALAPDWGSGGEVLDEGTGAQVLAFSRAEDARERRQEEAAAHAETPTTEDAPEAALAPAKGASDDETGPAPADDGDEVGAAPEPSADGRALPPLPDLPADPPDTIAADPGPLTRLAALPRPLAAPVAGRLATLAQAWRARGLPGR